MNTEADIPIDVVGFDVNPPASPRAKFDLQWKSVLPTWIPKIN